MQIDPMELDDFRYGLVVGGKALASFAPGKQLPFAD